MCLFCIAVFAVLAGAVTGAVVTRLEHRLGSIAADKRVKRISDTASTAVFSLDVVVPEIPGQPRPATPAAPVQVTVHKAQKRVRIQINHKTEQDYTPVQAEAIQDLIAQACGLKVVSRSTEQTRRMIGQALGELTPVPPASESTYSTPEAQPGA
jgi:hypothetical protein